MGTGVKILLAALVALVCSGCATQPAPAGTIDLSHATVLRDLLS